MFQLLFCGCVVTPAALSVKSTRRVKPTHRQSQRAASRQREALPGHTPVLRPGVRPPGSAEHQAVNNGGVELRSVGSTQRHNTLGVARDVGYSFYEVPVRPHARVEV